MLLYRQRQTKAKITVLELKCPCPVYYSDLCMTNQCSAPADTATIHSYSGTKLYRQYGHSLFHKFPFFHMGYVHEAGYYSELRLSCSCMASGWLNKHLPWWLINVVDALLQVSLRSG